MNKYFIPTASFLMMTALLTGCNTSSSAPAAETARPAPTAERFSVQTLTLQKEPFRSFIEAAGPALPVRESLLSVPVSGIIDEILVQRGERVKKGQVLLRLDQRGFRLAVEQAEAGLAAARAGFSTLQEEMKRFDRLLANKAVPQSNYDKVRAQYDAASAQLAAAEAGLKQARKALSDSELRAPYDGEITAIYKEVGEFAPAMPPTMLMKLVDASRLQVQVFLPESEGPFIRRDQPARVIAEGAPGEMDAQVVFVSPRLEPGSQTFEVRLELDNTGRQIKAGAFCRVRLVRREMADALLLPVRAVLWEGGRNFVFVEENGLARRLEVTLGETEGDRVLVLAGLSAGQRLITSGLDRLRDGQPVGNTR